MGSEKILSKEKVNKNAIYRVFCSLWYTKEWVNFVEMVEGTFLVKFGLVEDRDRILNLSPWLFDQNIFSLVPFVKEKDLDE